MNSHDEIKIFMDNVLYLRKSYGYTQKQMADRLDISLYQLRLLEKGVLPKNLSTAILFRIHDVFAIHPKDLFRPLFR
ncbi:MAG: helix-turn-helix domain-containing protein [Acutalibacteraceae bacterium]